MTWETILYERRGAVAILTLNRPERMNSMNIQLQKDVIEALDEYDADDSVRALIFTGGPKVFCAGADVREVATFTTTAQNQYFFRLTRTMFHRVEHVGKPVIAAIGGMALGGGLELALCCDLRVAAEGAKIGLTEVRLGAMPGAGGTQRLPRLIGPALTKQLIFTGNPITAEEALQMGIINYVVPADSLLDKALEVGGVIAERAPLALRMAKSCINTALEVDLESGLNYETQCATYLSNTEDQKEGFRAFGEKRKPEWKGR